MSVGELRTFKFECDSRHCKSCQIIEAATEPKAPERWKRIKFMVETHLTFPYSEFIYHFCPDCCVSNTHNQLLEKIKRRHKGQKSYEECS